MNTNQTHYAEPLEELMAAAAAQRDIGKGDHVTYSRKVFIPLTELCRDVCHYCTYAKTPSRLDQAYLLSEDVLRIAEAGKAAGCREALFTLGDKPELRYRAAREALDKLGCATTLEYVKKMAQLVLDETGLLPHLNPGVLQREDYDELREVSPSMGIMLESASTRLAQRGGPHFGSPDKHPQARLASIAAAGAASVPLTTGILIGIGETRQERIDSLIALQELHADVVNAHKLELEQLYKQLSEGQSQVETTREEYSVLEQEVALGQAMAGHQEESRIRDTECEASDLELQEQLVSFESVKQNA